ncbi:MAG: nucleotidyltransferase family protein [Acidobacteria bacterium]|nr:nucleotidyltransferase family protein [Acidobacteriota bacterium]
MTEVEPLLIDLAVGRKPRAARDPAALVAAAADQRMLGLLWQATRSGDVALDEVQKKRIAIGQVRSRSREAKIVAVLPKVLEIARSIDVRLVLFKGAALEYQLYRVSGLRPYTDLDIAVAPESRARFGELVERLDPAHSLANNAQRLSDAGVLDSIDIQLDGVWIDLHVDPFKVGLELREPDLVWDSTEVVDIAGIDVEVFGLEAAALQMMLHELKDRFSFLIGHCDLLRLCTDPKLDRELLQKMISAQGYSSLFTFVMDVVEDDLAQVIHPTKAVRGWRHVVARRVWPSHIRLGGSQGRVDHHRRQQFIPFLATGRVLEALRWWRHVVFPSTVMLVYWGEQLHPHHPKLRGPYFWKLLSRRRYLRRDRRSEDV